MIVEPRALQLDLPSPVRPGIRSRGHELWIKDDGAIHPIYGGNKARKLSIVLARAQSREARRIVTAGAAGSHHVLATGLLADSLGISTTALVFPRRWSLEAEQTLIAAYNAGVELVALSSPADLVPALTRILRSTDFVVPPGATSPGTSQAYLEAALELERQVREGLLPEPDLLYVALGTGGTAAGLLAGLAAARLKTRLVGVSVLTFPGAGLWVWKLARSALRHRQSPNRIDPAQLWVDRRWIGEGYGHVTDAARRAQRRARQIDLTLEGTYTAKAFAAAIDGLSTPMARGMVRPALGPIQDRPLRILFWTTLSSTCCARTKTDPTRLPPTSHLPPSLARLLRWR